MKYFIKRIRISGIKNIRKEVEFNFYNKTIKKPFDITDSNVKALYGENGSGKSAIIHAIKIYHDLINQSNYLFEKENNVYISELTNFEILKLNFQMTFVVYSEKMFRIIEHKIILNSNESNNVKIESEEIFLWKKNSYKEEDKECVYSSLNGIIDKFIYSNDLRNLSTNRLQKESVVSVYFQSILTPFIHEYRSNNEDINKLNKNEINSLLQILQLVKNINVYMDSQDDHDEYIQFIKIRDNSNVKIVSEVGNIDFSVLDTNEMIDFEKLPKSKYSFFVLKDEQTKFKKKISQLEQFIKLFKPDLKGIFIDFRPSIKEKIQIAELIFDYGGKRKITLEFESTGIRKLVNLFDAFVQLELGKIVIIDEFDANINDVYLIKIIDYFSEYSNGQLFFTTHNIGPMEVLAKKKHAIDFISSDNQITSSILNGNYSISKQYRKGFIKNLPFNIGSADFIGMFDSGETIK